MKNIVSQLTKEGLFFVLGKLYYAQALLEGDWGDEGGAAVNIEPALSEIEEAKEPLLRLLIGPPDLRSAFVEYLKVTHELTLDFIDDLTPANDDLVSMGPRLSVVKSDDQSSPPK